MSLRSRKLAVSIGTTSGALPERPVAPTTAIFTIARLPPAGVLSSSFRPEVVPCCRLSPDPGLRTCFRDGQACIGRFGTLRPEGPTPLLRSDNGLVFQSRRFRAACKDYRLRQEFITPYTPQQNGIVERFFRSLKEECVWQHNFADFRTALRTIPNWLNWYNECRPHQSLGYRSPREFRALQSTLVA